MSKRDAERDQRLAEALRQNLRRRKTQAPGESLAEPPHRHRDGDGDGDDHA